MNDNDTTRKYCLRDLPIHGIRRFDARKGVIELDPNWMKVSAECSMRYKKSGLSSAVNCRGYVRRAEIG